MRASCCASSPTGTPAAEGWHARTQSHPAVGQALGGRQRRRAEAAAGGRARLTRDALQAVGVQVAAARRLAAQGQTHRGAHLRLQHERLEHGAPGGGQAGALVGAAASEQGRREGQECGRACAAGQR